VTLDQQVLFPQFPIFEDQTNVTGGQTFFSTDAQEPFPSISDAMSMNLAISGMQTETSNASFSTEPSTGAKKPKGRGRKKSAAPKVQSSSAADSQCFPPMIPQLAQQQMNLPSFGLDQLTDTDPFISDASHFGSLNNTQAVTYPGVPGIAQTPCEVDSTAQQPEQMLTDYSMFFKLPSETSSPASFSGMGSVSNHGPGYQMGTPSSDNKRKAQGPHGMETPTKRRQSLINQGAAGPSIQQAPEQNQAQEFQTPRPVSVDPLLYDISPPSAKLTFGTSIKGGICAVVTLVLKEAKKRGTVFSQVLNDGPGTDFSAPETGAQIKQTTKAHIVAANAMKPDDGQQAFANGAYKALQAIFQEMEERGSVFGKGLLLGPLSGNWLAEAKQGMAKMYMDVSAMYRSPPKFSESAGQSAQIEQTPTRTSHSPATAWDLNATPTNIPNQMLGGGSTFSSIPEIPDNTFLSGAFPGYAISQPNEYVVSQPNGDVASSPTPANGYITASTQHHQAPLPTSVPLYNNNTTIPDLTSPATLQFQSQPKPKPKRQRKPSTRARKSSTTNHPSSPTNPDDGLPTTNATNTNGQMVPKSLYSFADKTFYVQLALSGSDVRHKIGYGTTQLAGALARFLEAARERFGIEGEEDVPAGFEFRQWEGVEENLEGLRRVLMGGGGV
jgi:hypothetical protein